MSQECLISGCQRKFSMENCKKESAHKVAKRNATMTPLKPRLRISIFQLSQDRTKWRCLINKDAFQFEAKRICEAERKRKERKARAKGPSSDSAQSEFICSICNRQFRAKIGLYSHQRTHKHTYTPNIQDIRWPFSVVRDEQSQSMLVDSHFWFEARIVSSCTRSWSLLTFYI